MRVNPGHPTTPTAAAQHRFTLIWHSWLAGVAVTFGILETHALITGGEGATLTAHLRRSLGVSPRRRYRPAGRGLLLAVFGWLAAHLVFGVWPSEGWHDRPGQPDGAVVGGDAPSSAWIDTPERDAWTKPAPANSRPPAHPLPT